MLTFYMQTRRVHNEKPGSNVYYRLNYNENIPSRAVENIFFKQPINTERMYYTVDAAIRFHSNLFWRNLTNKTDML